jgi:hypothetical protein
MLLRPSIIAAVLGLCACAAPADRPKLILSGSHFFDEPWPSDRRTVDGHPDMDGFPGQDDFDLVATYTDQISQLTGFGTNAAIFARFDRKIAESDLPAPGESAHQSAPYFLIDIDPRSPQRGRFVPLTSRFQQDETLWQPENLLALEPVLGFPLQPRTTYALVFTTDFAAPIAAMADAWKPGTPDYAYFEDLNNTLLQVGVPRASVAHAIRFTTQDPVGEMARFEARIAEDLTTPPLDQALGRLIHFDAYTSFIGDMWIPMWQHGEKPYLTEGGNFVFDDEGRPLLQGWERVRFTLSVPFEQAMPAEGWPVVIYAHGTGGAHYGFADGLQALEPANVLGEVGIVGIGISLPLHGDRSTGLDPALASFNYLNPASAGAVFRQAALDQIYLAEILSARPHSFTLDDNSVIRTDPQRVAYMGHSHGGLVGAIAAPFMGDRVRAMFLSGAGGGLSTTLTTRDAGDFDIQQVLVDTFEFDENEALVTSHPLVSAVQTLAETTDPINYAPYWFHRSPFWQTTPMSVLMTEGLHDLQTPPATAEGLAAAGGLPILSPVEQVSGGHGYRGTPTATTPTAGNLLAWTGAAVTGGLAQYADEDHFAIFQDPAAAALYQHFLLTALDGTPEVLER